MNVSQTHSRTADWPAWKGTVEDVAEAALTALSVLERRPGRVSTPQVSITVHQPGLESEYETVDALRMGVTSSDLARVTEIVIHASEWAGQDSGHVFVRYGTLFTGARLTVSGTDRLWVDGAVSELQTVLDRGRRASPRSMEWSARGAAVVSAAAASAILGAAFPELSGVELFGIVSLFVLAAAFLFLVDPMVGRLIPRLELLGPGADTRWDRARRPVTRAALAVGGIILAAVAYAVAEQLLS